jgi:hypothetical protein
MEKLFVVYWSSAEQGGDSNPRAFCGIHGLYKSLPAAKNGLLECKNKTYSEVVDNPDCEEEGIAKATVQVHGSVDEEYFKIEIDDDIGVVHCEINIKIEEVTL